MDGARVSLWRFSFLALWVVVVDIYQILAVKRVLQMCLKSRVHFLDGWTGLKLGNGRNTVSRALFRRRELTEPHWVLGQTRWVLQRTRWVRVYTQIIGWKELTEFASRNSVSPKKLTEFGVWNRTPRNRIRPVSDKRTFRIIFRVSIPRFVLEVETFRGNFVLQTCHSKGQKWGAKFYTSHP